MTTLAETLIAVMKQQSLHHGLSLREVQEAAIDAICEYTFDETVKPMFHAMNDLDGLFMNTVKDWEDAI